MKRIPLSDIRFHVTVYKYSGNYPVGWHATARHPSTILCGFGQSEIESSLAQLWALDDLVWKLRNANASNVIGMD